MRLDFTFWDEWRGSLDGRPTMWISRLIKIPFWRRDGKWLTVRVDLHKFIGADDPECFHTHPAWAVRVILRGGYTEQIFEQGMRAYNYWFPGDVGIVAPWLCHRVDSLMLGPSISLWIRGPICADIKLIGDGWATQRPKETA